jgi:cobalt-zinc-cadmium resistance protein CzcA
MSFTDWQTAKEEAQLQERLLAIYSELAPKMEKRFELGAVDLVEYRLFMNQLVLLEQKAAQRGLEEERSERKLRLNAFLPDSIPISTDGLKLYSDSLPISNTAEHPYLKALDQRALLVQEHLKMQKTTTRQWDLSAGYFGQTLEGKSTFQGFLIGLQVPLDTRINGVREKQALIEEQMLRTEQVLLEKELMDRIALLREGMLRSKASISSYESEVRPGMEDLGLGILARYENGEIDFFQFSQLEHQLIQQELDYLDLIRQYNRNYLELDLLTIK